MSKGENQKLKLLYLMKIFLEKTDEEHMISMSEIISSLNAYGVSAERKSIYNDIEQLNYYGMDIISEKRNGVFGYYAASRLFEIPELKLLVDSVQSAKFITAKKSNELIKKLESFVSKYDAVKLQRQVYMSGRIKTMNESVYYNVDYIHQAIAENVKIKFQYFSWNEKKEMELRKNGDKYFVSPIGLCCVEENYYLIAYEEESGIIKHFRVDKMLNIDITDSKREKQFSEKKFDVAGYLSKMTGMFDGEKVVVIMECENYLANVIIDKFGKDIMIRRIDDHHFETSVKAAVSRQFIYWVLSLGDGVKITSPKKVVQFVKDEIARLSEKYE